MSSTLFIFQFEISEIEINDEHDLNKLFILFILLVFQFEISGNDINEEHSQNIKLILVTFFIPFNFISITSKSNLLSSIL